MSSYDVVLPDCCRVSSFSLGLSCYYEQIKTLLSLKYLFRTKTWSPTVNTPSEKERKREKEKEKERERETERVIKTPKNPRLPSFKSYITLIRRSSNLQDK